MALIHLNQFVIIIFNYKFSIVIIEKYHVIPKMIMPASIS